MHSVAITAGVDWTHSLRRAPLGVLVLGTLLFFAGGSLLVGGVYLAAAGKLSSVMIPLLAAIGGGLAAYVALKFLLLRRRAWSAAVVLLILLALYAGARAVMNPVPLPIYPLGEMAFEVVALVYLTRRSVRELFT